MSFTEEKNDGAVYAGQPKDNLAAIMDKIRGIDTFEKLAEFAGVDIEESRIGINWFKFGSLYFYNYGNIEIGEDAITTEVLKEEATTQQMAMIVASFLWGDK